MSAFALHDVYLKIFLPLALSAWLTAFICAIYPRKSERTKRVGLFGGFVFMGSILAMFALVLGAEQARWDRMEALLLSRVTQVVVTCDGRTVELTGDAARVAYGAIVSGERTAAHHSHPVDECKFAFAGEGFNGYVYTVAPDSERADEFWISDIAPGEASGSMGRFVSPALTLLFDEWFDPAPAPAERTVADSPNP